MRQQKQNEQPRTKFKFGAMGPQRRLRPFQDSMVSALMGASLHSRVRTLADMDAAERAALERTYGMPIARGA